MQGLMKPYRVILFESLSDDGLCIAADIKPFCVEPFSADRLIDALVISILSG